MNITKKTHIGAYAIIIKENKIALIKKSRGGYKGKYDLPGGGIEHTESPEETLKRECLEEIGGTITEYKLLDVESVNIKWNISKDEIEDLHHIGIIYISKIKENELKTEADGLDSEGALWIEISKITKEKVSPFTWQSLKKLNYK